MADRLGGGAIFCKCGGAAMFGLVRYLAGLAEDVGSVLDDTAGVQISAPMADRQDVQVVALILGRIGQGLGRAVAVAAKAIAGSGSVSQRFARRLAVAAIVVAPLLSLPSVADSASGVQYCAQIPIVGGIPPWGFHTGAPITGSSGSYARGHGDINLSANTVSGILCQVDRAVHQPDHLIIMTVEHHLVYHSHHALMWGFPGNVMKIIVRVQSSTDPQCQVGTIGHVTLFASYNGVRSDSVKFMFPAGCSGHDHLYHGPQVNNQVPPL